MKKHPVTGEDVPDDTARVAVERYVNPRKAEWPKADFVVGNPPFLGPGRMRAAFGDGYTDAVRDTYPDVPESSDYVMYWWHKAGALLAAGRIRRFGLITTNSIRQAFARRVIEAFVRLEKDSTREPIGLTFAIPDHPWVDSTDGAAVRIAMTVAARNGCSGQLCEVVAESEAVDEHIPVTLRTRFGTLSPDLRLGVSSVAAIALRGNARLASRGFCLFGSGFIVSREKAQELGLGKTFGLEQFIRPYRNGKDLTQNPRGALVIDLFGLTECEVRTQFPSVYQHIVNTVKPERDHNSRDSYRTLWWVHGEPRREIRKALAGLPRFICTVETSKHRFFQFLSGDIAPDNMLVAIASEDAFHLGAMSSRIHVVWALAAGGRLGVGNDPRYNKSKCFDPFPFPAATESQQQTIRDLGEALDAHRKKQ